MKGIQMLECQYKLTAINGNAHPSLYPKGAQLVTQKTSDTGEKNKGKSQEYGVYKSDTTQPAQ